MKTRHRSFMLCCTFLLAALPAAAFVDPLGEEFRVNVTTDGLQKEADVAVATDGTFVVVWSSASDSTFKGVFARLYDANGQPASGEIAVFAQAVGRHEHPAVAALPGGGFAVAWEAVPSAGARRRVLVRFFDGAGDPLTGEMEVGGETSQSGAAIAAGPGGAVAVAWTEVGGGGANRVGLRFFDASGAAGAGPIAAGDALEPAERPDVAFVGDTLFVAWFSVSLAPVPLPGPRILAARYGPTGAALSGPFDVSGGAFAVSPPVLATAGVGAQAELLAAWQGFEPTPFLPPVSLYSRRIDAAGEPRNEPIVVPLPGAQFDVAGDLAGNYLFVGSDGSEVFARLVGPGDLVRTELLPVNTFRPFFQKEPAVALGPQGTAVVVWESGEEPTPLDTGQSPRPGQDGSFLGVYGQRFRLVGASTGALLLRDGRFLVEVDWREPRGRTGTGRGSALTSDTGTFWFFRPDNLELAVKILDGRAVTGAFWVFYGSMTNVEFVITITDLETGKQRLFHNPQGRLGGGSDTRTFQDPASPLSLPAPEGRPSVSPTRPLLPRSAGCPIVPGAPCLDGARFQIEVEWTNQRNGQSGVATGVQLTADTAYFWFFQASNVELIVKMIDGTPVNGHHWLFVGSLTDLEVRVTVTDTESGVQASYRVPGGSQASIVDTTAFPLTP